MDKKIKVALLTNIISPYRVHLFEKLASNPKIDLDVYFCSKTHSNREWTTPKKFEFNYKLLSGKTLNIFGVYCHINISIISELIKRNYKIIIIGGYDSITNYLAFILSKLRRTPIILWSGSTKNEISFIRKLSLPLVKLIVKYSDAYIAYGNRAKDYLVSLGAEPQKIFKAYNTVDTEYFKKENLKYKHKKNKLKAGLGIKNKLVIGYVGQLNPRKNVEFLISAYSKLKSNLDVALVIVGDGSLRGELELVCKSKRIKDVFFVGFKQKGELPRYYALFDLFVLPSKTEVWGLVLNEAMASGLPVVTNHKVGGSEDLIKNGLNGFVVKSGELNQLCQAMKRILSNPKLTKTMGKESQYLIDKKFTINHASESFISAIKYCLEEEP